MAAPVHQGFTTAVNNTATTFLDNVLPTGVVSGDLLIHEVVTRSSGEGWDTGFVEIYNDMDNGFTRGAAATKLAGPAESSPKQVTFNNSVAVAGLHRISGASGAVALGAVGTGASALDATAPSMTATADNLVMCHLGVVQDQLNQNTGYPPDWSGSYALRGRFGGSSTVSGASAHRTYGAGPTGAAVWAQPKTAVNWATRQYTVEPIAAPSGFNPAFARATTI